VIALSGISLDSSTRPLLNFRSSPKSVFPIDNSMYYSVPTADVVKRIFQTDMETKVYNSLKDKVSDNVVHGLNWVRFRLILCVSYLFADI
jgi:hypothetical protein